MPRTQSRYHIGFGFVVPTRTKPDTNIVLGSEGLTRVPTFRGREPETTTIAGWRAVLFTTVAGWRAVLSTTVAGWRAMLFTTVAGWRAVLLATVSGWRAVLLATVSGLGIFRALLH